MKRQRQRINTREMGLEVAAIAGKYFFKSDHLHYGFWPVDLDVDIANLRRAQEQHATCLISHLPKGVHSILDVGCGTGRFTAALADLGYHVDAVSPCCRLNEYARPLIGARGRAYDSRFESLESDTGSLGIQHWVVRMKGRMKRTCPNTHRRAPFVGTAKRIVEAPKPWNETVLTSVWLLRDRWQATADRPKILLMDGPGTCLGGGLFGIILQTEAILDRT